MASISRRLSGRDTWEHDNVSETNYYPGNVLSMGVVTCVVDGEESSYWGSLVERESREWNGRAREWLSWVFATLYELCKLAK